MDDTNFMLTKYFGEISFVVSTYPPIPITIALLEVWSIVRWPGKLDLSANSK